MSKVVIDNYMYNSIINSDEVKYALKHSADPRYIGDKKIDNKAAEQSLAEINMVLIDYRLCLDRAIETVGALLGGTAVAAISPVNLDPQVIIGGHSSNNFSVIGYEDYGALGVLNLSINLIYKNNLIRPSLNKKLYGSIKDITALINNGYDYTRAPVHGLWHGVNISALRERPATSYMQKSIEFFNDTCRTELLSRGISVNLDLDDKYFNIRIN